MKEKHYIDKIEHNRVGVLGDWTMYHPIGTIQGKEWWSNEFSCNPNQLVINGGGYFEHPVIIVTTPKEVVARYLVEIGLNKCELDPDFEAWYIKFFDDTLYPILKNYLEKLEPIFLYPGAIPETYIRIDDTIRDSDIFNSPYDDDTSIEGWLFCSLGEFIWFDYPDICPEFISELKSVVNYIDKKTWGNVDKYSD